MERTIKQISICIIIIFCTLGCQNSTSEKENSVPIHFNENAFSFVIPKGWSEISNYNLTDYKSEFENNVAAIAANYHGQKLDYDFGVPFMVGFESPKEEVLFIAYILQIPPQSENYLQETFQNSRDKLKWLMDNKKIDSVISNEITTLNKLPCIKSEMEANGKRMGSYCFFNDSIPYKVANINIIYESNQFSDYEQQVSDILSSLQVRIK